MAPGPRASWRTVLDRVWVPTPHGLEHGLQGPWEDQVQSTAGKRDNVSSQAQGCGVSEGHEKVELGWGENTCKGKIK